MLTQVTYGLIEPEIVKYKLPIVQKIQQQKLEVSVRPIVLWIGDVKAIYPALDPVMFSHSCAHLCCSGSFLLRVTGIDAIELLKGMKGSDPDPSKCSEMTFRRTYGDPRGIPLPDGRFYWLNGFHCCANQAEVDSHEQRFGKLFGANQGQVPGR